MLVWLAAPAASDAHSLAPSAGGHEGCAAALRVGWVLVLRFGWLSAFPCSATDAWPGKVEGAVTVGSLATEPVAGWPESPQPMAATALAPRTARSTEMRIERSMAATRLW
jgi:hypothetical protein